MQQRNRTYRMNWRAGLALLLLIGTAQAESLTAQRARYEQAIQAMNRNQTEQARQLTAQLQEYPLYPYLLYRQLEQNMALNSVADVQRFVQRYAALPLADQLSARFINELARREDWQSLLRFAPTPPQATASRCHYYYARQATGQRQIAWQGARELWLSGKSLPGACDALFSAWQAAGQRPDTLVTERMQLALDARNTALVRYLARQYSAGSRGFGQAVLTLLDRPESVTLFARQQPSTPLTRALARQAVAQLARQNAWQAQQVIPAVATMQHLNAADRQAIEEQVALRMMDEMLSAEQVRWREQVVARSRSTPLLESRLRLALRQGEVARLDRWIQRLPAQDQQKDEWRYWRAMALQAQHKPREAQTILRELVRSRGFYAMAAAQRLNIAYSFVQEAVPHAAAPVAQQAAIRRIEELIYWQQRNSARREWNALLKGKSRSEQAQLARFARQRGWADLSVQATIVGKLWNQLAERFPVAWPTLYRRETATRRVTQSYAMAITRQESAWNSQARSPVGASGLMQLMPATAAHVAKQEGMTEYTSREQLFNPTMNIRLGVAYLDSVYQRFDENRIFAAAAYNAGPTRVRRWLENSGGRLDAVAFIETIPFAETRRYVKNVLAYDAYYRYFMHQPARSLFTYAEWRRRY